MSVYTVHQASFKNGKLHELQILCRDEPEPPIFFYEENVVSVEQVINYMVMGDLFYAQWGEQVFEIELTSKPDGEVTIEIAPKGQDASFNTLANLPSEVRIFG
jgi:hypothetical protein